MAETRWPCLLRLERCIVRRILYPRIGLVELAVDAFAQLLANHIRVDASCKPEETEGPIEALRPRRDLLDLKHPVARNKAGA